MILEFCADCGAPLGKPPPCACASCGAEFWDNAKPCGGAFVTHRGRLLLVQRAHAPWAGHWDVPGGFCDGAEHPEATTLREVREETGLAIRLTGLLGMWIDRYGDDTTYATLNIYFHAVPDPDGPDGPDGVDGDVVAAVVAEDEIAAVRWFTPAELADAPLAFPDHMGDAVDRWLTWDAGRT